MSEFDDVFKPGRRSDSEEQAKGEKHIRPDPKFGGKDGKLTEGTPHVQVPAGNWVDVKNGMVAAPGTYVDSEGVLRSTGDHSCVVWHKSKLSNGERCERKGIQPNQIVYSMEGAPWCPDCWEDNMKTGEMEKERKKIAALFKKN